MYGIEVTNLDDRVSTEKDDKGYVVYHSEGQVRQVDNVLHWEYAIRDHLGNTRILYDDHDGDNSLHVLQNNQYYAFGMSMYGEWSKQGMSENDYKYNGKELNSELGLGLYDYEARFYDPAIGRFLHVDPLADQRSWVSPYSYVQNNPIIRIDPTGMLDTFPGAGDMLSGVAQGINESYIEPIESLVTNIFDFFKDDGDLKVIFGEGNPTGPPIEAPESDQSRSSTDMPSTPGKGLAQKWGAALLKFDELKDNLFDPTLVPDKNGWRHVQRPLESHMSEDSYINEDSLVDIRPNIITNSPDTNVWLAKKANGILNASKRRVKVK